MIHVTGHACLRYRERVADISDEAIREALSCKAILAAVEFRYELVRLPGGQRVVLDGATVVTVLPANEVGAKNWPRFRMGDAHYGRDRMNERTER